MKTGDKMALFGAESSDFEGGEPSVGLIGVLTLEFVRGDKITYVVTPAVAKDIQDTVDRYMAASNRRMWKVGFELPTQDLIDLYGQATNVPAAADGLFDDVGAGLEPIDEP